MQRHARRGLPLKVSAEMSAEVYFTLAADRWFRRPDRQKILLVQRLVRRKRELCRTIAFRRWAVINLVAVIEHT